MGVDPKSVGKVGCHQAVWSDAPILRAKSMTFLLPLFISQDVSAGKQNDIKINLAKHTESNSLKGTGGPFSAKLCAFFCLIRAEEADVICCFN